MVDLRVSGQRGRRLLLVTVLVATAALGIGLSHAGAASAAKTRRVSVSSAGTQGHNDSEFPSISAHGRFVAFESLASNLVGDDTNTARDVFVFDRSTQKTRRVSVSSAGTQGNRDSYRPSISTHGRFVAFYSDASNLVGNDTNHSGDVFVYDRTTHKTRRVSVSSTGTQGNRDSYGPSISANGRFVAFISAASNLVGADTNVRLDVFVYDRTTHKTRRVSVSSTGTQGNRRSGTYAPSISPGGRFVAFDSLASNLVGNDTNNIGDLFVYDRTTHKTRRVSVSSAGTQGNSVSYAPSISAGGRFVAFDSYASNLVGDDTNASSDVFVYDRSTHETSRVSVNSAGTQGDDFSSAPSISANGRFVAFYSNASNLVGGIANLYIDVFVHDRSTHKTRLVSVSSTGTQSNHNSYVPSISADGRFVAFYSNASNLVWADTNRKFDVFVRGPLR